MKKGCLIVACCLGMVFVLGAAWRIWDKATLCNSARITKETGLVLPPDAMIVATEADTLTLCDGLNYGWLIETSTDMTPWIEANMHRKEGWKHVNTFGEVAPLASGPSSLFPLDSVWESDKIMPDGRIEEAFLCVAGGRKNAMVTTFRP